MAALNKLSFGSLMAQGSNIAMGGRSSFSLAYVQPSRVRGSSKSGRDSVLSAPRASLQSPTVAAGAQVAETAVELQNGFELAGDAKKSYFILS